MKKFLIVLMTLAIVLGVAGCSGKEEGGNSTANTVGTKLQAVFEAEAKENKDAETILTDLSNNEVIDFSPVTMEVEPGYLAGFSADITGFTKGYVLAPMIGSIPFVCYVFEADDASALLKSLQDNADPRWNICTEADETVYATSGNLVFFAMVSNEE